jgi:hypothetical protein
MLASLVEYQVMDLEACESEHRKMDYGSREHALLVA